MALLAPSVPFGCSSLAALQSTACSGMLISDNNLITEISKIYLNCCKAESSIDKHLNWRMIAEIIDVEVDSLTSFLISRHFHG